MIDFVRTPESRFNGIPDYPYQPNYVLKRWTKPFLTVYSNGDPVLGEMDAQFHERVPGAAGQPHARVEGGRFLQEAASSELARRIHELIITDRGSM